jgi:hypothetical protein
LQLLVFNLLRQAEEVKDRPSQFVTMTLTIDGNVQTSRPRPKSFLHNNASSTEPNNYNSKNASHNPPPHTPPRFSGSSITKHPLNNQHHHHFHLAGASKSTQKLS